MKEVEKFDPLKMYEALGLPIGTVLQDEIYPQDYEQQAEARPEKKKFIPRSPGRGKGNIAKATISRTASFREALDDDDWADIAITAFNRLMDPATKNADFVKLATFLARYNLLSADAQMVIDSDAGALKPEVIDKLRMLIKEDGLPQFFPKTKTFG